MPNWLRLLGRQLEVRRTCRRAAPEPRAARAFGTEIQSTRRAPGPEGHAAGFTISPPVCVRRARRALPVRFRDHGRRIYPQCQSQLLNRLRGSRHKHVAALFNGGLYKAAKRRPVSRAGFGPPRNRSREQDGSRRHRRVARHQYCLGAQLYSRDSIVEQASQSLELRRTRYDLGLSSIVEFSQAQLVRTNADIQFASASTTINCGERSSTTRPARSELTSSPSNILSHHYPTFLRAGTA